MKINGKDYQSLWREQETIHFIDQRKLPNTFEIYSTKTIDDIAYAIKEMVVRGGPAIGAGQRMAWQSEIKIQKEQQHSCGQPDQLLMIFSTQSSI